MFHLMGNKAKIRRRQRCSECGSLDIIKWGIRNGIQRLRCRNCKSPFSARRKEISKSNRFPWFRKWVSGRMTIEEISASSGYSSRQSDKKHRYQPQIINKYVRVIDIMMSLPDTLSLMKINSLNYEKLKGDKKGLSSVRVNDRYRIEFEEYTVDGQSIATI